MYTYISINLTIFRPRVFIESVACCSGTSNFRPRSVFGPPVSLNPPIALIVSIPEHPRDDDSTKGILLTPKSTITERGGTRALEGKLNMSPVEVLVNLWRHECERVFCDKLTTNKVQ